MAQRTDRRSEADLGVRAPGGRVGPFEFHLALFEPVFLQIFELKWSKR
jgi:hypothetical protein